MNASHVFPSLADVFVLIDFRQVSAMTANDGMHTHKKGALARGRIRRGDGMTAYSAPFVYARALFGCAYVILRECCHAVTTLTGERLTNELGSLLGDSECRHVLSWPSLTWRALA
jgi:hypothetical protein